jgi:hypothetical protein
MRLAGQAGLSPARLVQAFAQDIIPWSSSPPKADMVQHDRDCPLCTKSRHFPLLPRLACARNIQRELVRRRRQPIGFPSLRQAICSGAHAAAFNWVRIGK